MVKRTKGDNMKRAIAITFVAVSMLIVLLAGCGSGNGYFEIVSAEVLSNPPYQQSDLIMVDITVENNTSDTVQVSASQFYLIFEAILDSHNSNRLNGIRAALIDNGIILKGLTIDGTTSIRPGESETLAIGFTVDDLYISNNDIVYPPKTVLDYSDFSSTEREESLKDYPYQIYLDVPGQPRVDNIYKLH